MNIAIIRTFLEVVDSGNFNKAAHRMNVTPSTVTMRINVLEERLGERLLIRNKSSSTLTSAGFRFKRYAQILDRTWNQAYKELALTKRFDGVCNVGCHFSLWHGLGLKWLDKLRALRPKMAVSAWGSDHHELALWLNSGMIDISFAFDAQKNIDSDFNVEQLFSEEIIKVISSTELMPDGYDYIYIDHGSTFRRWHAMEHPDRESEAIIINNSEWGLEYILNKGGSAYLPLRLCSHYLTTGQLNMAEDGKVFSREIYMSYNIDKAKSWTWFDTLVHQIKSSNP